MSLSGLVSILYMLDKHSVLQTYKTKNQMKLFCKEVHKK